LVHSSLNHKDDLVIMEFLFCLLNNMKFFPTPCIYRELGSGKKSVGLNIYPFFYTKKMRQKFQFQLDCFSIQSLANSI
jgi:hypothetical protein